MGLPASVRARLALHSIDSRTSLGIYVELRKVPSGPLELRDRDAVGTGRRADQLKSGAHAAPACAAPDTRCLG